MFSLSKGIHTDPTMDWRCLRERLFNRWSRALNSINRDSLKKATVTRRMISDGILIRSAGVRMQQGEGVLGQQDHNMRLMAVNLQVDEYSIITVAYNIGLRVRNPPSPWIGRAFRSTVSVDGIRYGFGTADCQANVPFAGVAPGMTLAVVLSGVTSVYALAGPHTLSIGVEVPDGPDIDFNKGGDVSISAIGW